MEKTHRAQQNTPPPEKKPVKQPVCKSTVGFLQTETSRSYFVLTLSLTQL